MCVNLLVLGKLCENWRCFWENLHSWHKFYPTAGRDGRDKPQLCLAIVKYRVHNTYILSFKALELQRTLLLSNALRQHWLSALALGAVWLDFNDSTLCLEFPTHVWCEYH